MFFKRNKVENISSGEQLNNLSAETSPVQDFFDFVYDLLKMGVIVFILAFALRYFAIQPYIVDGDSMMPNYHNREYLLAEKLSYLFGSPKRGDVVIFKYPRNPSVNYIKRIIGLPGETVKIADDKITVINSQNPAGITLSEDYIPASFQTLTPDGATTYERKLLDNEYFVLGDNREHSSDSREWGVLPKANISGRAWLTLIPFDRFGTHDRVTYSNFSLSNYLQNSFAAK